MRTSIGKKTRFEVLKRDGFRCVYCGALAAGARLVMDHVLPVADGGTNVPHNLVACCEDCNQGKGRRPLGLAERMARLPNQAKPLRVWKRGDVVYLPRNMNEILPDSMPAAVRMELVHHLWHRDPGGGPFRFGGATVELIDGIPPRESWADPANGVL